MSHLEFHPDDRSQSRELNGKQPFGDRIHMRRVRRRRGKLEKRAVTALLFALYP